MTAAALRRQLEGAIQVLVAALVVSLMFAVGNIWPLNIPIGRLTRWAALAELCALALAYAFATRRRVRLDLPMVLALCLAAVVVVSALWSPERSLTLARAVSFVILLVAAAALAHGSRGRDEAVAAVLFALLAAAAIIAVAGLVNLWVAPERALEPATLGQGARFNGLAANANTTAMILALAVPLAAWAFWESRSRGGKVAAGITFLLFDVSIVATASRGAMLAASIGLAVFALPLVASRRSRVAVVAGALLLLVGNTALTQIPQPASQNPTVHPEFGSEHPISGQDARFLLPLENEIGAVPRGSKVPQRTLFGSGGRSAALRGAVGQALERPLLGYGFGTEERVFVDRYAIFLSSRVENSYVGTLLQLGLIGLALVLALLATIVHRGWRTIRALERRARSVPAACAAVVATGLVLAATQSYLTSVGSPSTAPVWICAFLLAAVAVARTDSGHGLEDGQRHERKEETA